MENDCRQGTLKDLVEKKIENVIPFGNRGSERLSENRKDNHPILDGGADGKGQKHKNQVPHNEVGKKRPLQNCFAHGQNPKPECLHEGVVPLMRSMK